MLDVNVCHISVLVHLIVATFRRIAVSIAVKQNQRYKLLF